MYSDSHISIKHTTDEVFFNTFQQDLLRLLDPYMFANPGDLDKENARKLIDKVMIRRGKETIYELDDQKRLVKKFKDRVPHPIEISFSEDERQLYQRVSEYTSTAWAKLTRKRNISQIEKNIGKFLLTLVQKRMVSSLAALRETLKCHIDSIKDARVVNKIHGIDIKTIKRLLKDYEQNQFMDELDREAVEQYIETKHIQSMYADRTNEVKTLKELLSKTEGLIDSGQDTKIENQIKVHRHRMQERRKAIEHMEAGAFPAPELLNMVFVIPV